MDESMETRRIQPGDALAVLLDDLVRTAPTAALTAEDFVRWFTAAVDLLACVPDQDQRMAWAYQLVVPLPFGRTWACAVLGDLLRFAEEVRLCRL